MTVVILVVFVLTSVAVYRSATVNQGAARMAAMQIDAVSRENDMSVNMLSDISQWIYDSMEAGNGSLAADRGDINITSLAVNATLRYRNSNTRLALAGVNTTGKVVADWITGASFQASGTAIGGPFDLLQDSLTRWGDGPTGDDGDDDVWLYPTSLFGIVSPGDTFIARRYQWTTTISITDTRDPIATAAGRSVSRTVTQNRRYTLFEVPFQFSVIADKTLNIGSEASGTASGTKLAVQGAIYGRQVNLSGNVAIGGNAASSAGVSASGGTIRGQSVTIPSPWGTEIYAPGGLLADRKVSASSQARNSTFITIAPGRRYYCSATSTPTNWDLYTLPFYRCAVRIQITNTSSSSPAATVTAYNPTTVPGMTAATNTWNFNSANWSTQLFLKVGVTTTGTDDRPLFTVDPKALATWLQAQTGRLARDFNTIYIAQNPASTPSPTSAGDVAVSLSNTRRMSDVFTRGFALVTRQRFYYSSSFNVDTPTSGCIIISPDIRYGIGSNANQRVDFAGQIGVVSGGFAYESTNPTDFKQGAGQSVSLSQKQVTLTQINNPRILPPITLRNWLIVSEAQ